MWFNIGVKGVPQQAIGLLHPRGRRHDGLDPELVREEGIDLQGRLGRGHQPLEDPLVAESAQGRRHGVGAGQLHARCRRVGGHHQVGWQDPSRREDGHPQRRPPRRRGVHLVQGRRGAQGAGRCATPASTWISTARTASRSSTRTPTTRSGSPTSSWRPSCEDRDWPLRAVTTGEVVKTVRARDLFRQFAQAAWECADPGHAVRHHDQPLAHRREHRHGSTGQTLAREYMHIDNSACNLASLNLLQFLDEDGHLRHRGLQGGDRGRVHRAGDPRRQRRLPDARRSARTAAGSVSSGSATRTSARCSWRSASPTTPTRAGPGPVRSPR